MYTLLAFAAILAGLFPRAAGAQATVEPDPRYQAVARALTAVIEQQRAEHRIPAVSVAVVDGSRVVWARGFGWADSAAGVPVVPRQRIPHVFNRYAVITHPHRIYQYLILLHIAAGRVNLRHAGNRTQQRPHVPILNCSALRQFFFG